jgi:hypothetical protein
MYTIYSGMVALLCKKMEIQVLHTDMYYCWREVK